MANGKEEDDGSFDEEAGLSNDGNNNQMILQVNSDDKDKQQPTSTEKVEEGQLPEIAKLYQLIDMFEKINDLSAEKRAKKDKLLATIKTYLIILENIFPRLENDKKGDISSALDIMHDDTLENHEHVLNIRKNKAKKNWLSSGVTGLGLAGLNLAINAVSTAYFLSAAKDRRTAADDANQGNSTLITEKNYNAAESTVTGTQWLLAQNIATAISAFVVASINLYNEYGIIDKATYEHDMIGVWGSFRKELVTLVKKHQAENNKQEELIKENKALKIQVEDLGQTVRDNVILVRDKDKKIEELEAKLKELEVPISSSSYSKKG